MRSAKVVSISLPPDMNDEVMDIAKEERRSVSEVFREALRQYVVSRNLSEVRRQGKKQVKKMKLKPGDIARIVAQGRK